MLGCSLLRYWLLGNLCQAWWRGRVCALGEDDIAPDDGDDGDDVNGDAGNEEDVVDDDYDGDDDDGGDPDDDDDEWQ